MAVSISVGAGCASLLIIVLTVNSLVAGSTDIRDIQTSEHADEIIMTSQHPSNLEGEINLNGYWKRSPVTVSFFSVGLSQHQFDKIITIAQDAIEVTPQQNTNSTTTSFERWQDMLSSLSRESKNVPELQVIQAGQNADIKVYFEADPNPDGKPGKAKIARDKNTLEIIYSEVYIYSAYDLYSDGTFLPIFKHEMGHALGLGHSTSVTSVMHTPIIIVDSQPVGGIRVCETEAARHLYVDRIVQTVPCKPLPP